MAYVMLKLVDSASKAFGFIRRSKKSQNSRAFICKRKVKKKRKKEKKEKKILYVE